METWDYCTFWCDEMQEYGYVTRSRGDDVESLEVRPAEREDFLKFKLRILAGLGTEGWELVAAVGTQPQGKTLYFKRPAAAPAAS